MIQEIDDDPTQLVNEQPTPEAGDAPEEIPEDMFDSDEFQDMLWDMSVKSQDGGVQLDVNAPKERNCIYIRPKPGWVIKTVDQKGRKVFINVASHARVPEPPEITAQMLRDDGEQVRIPLSLGKMRLDKDNKGAECQVYDAIFHPAVLENCEKGKPVTQQATKEFAVEVVLQYVETKHDALLSRQVKFPKLASKGEIEMQTIRKNANEGPKVREMGEQKAIQPIEPEYAIEVSSRRFATLSDHLERPTVVVRVALPRITLAAQVTLEYSATKVFVEARGGGIFYKTAITLPHACARHAADSVLIRPKHVLKILLPVALASDEEKENPKRGKKGGKTGKKAVVAQVRPRNELADELD